MTTLSQFDYSLPPTLIANEPVDPRDHCRLLVFDRATGLWEHHYFYQLPSILARLPHPISFVRNNSRVIPARLYGRKPTGGKVELLLVRELSSSSHQQVWSCLTKPALKPSQTVILADSRFSATVTRITDSYSRTLSFPYSREDFMQILREYGHTPIPPYIHATLPESDLRRVYQTVYADASGSVAAPTAGLHFTDQLVDELRAAGHEFIDVTLHVGLGTFLGVQTEDLTQHHMHSEYYRIIPAQLQALLSALETGRPLLAVGTTATRVLESIYSRIFCDNNYSRKFCGNNAKLPPFRPDFDPTAPLEGDTSIFLYPPARFHLTRHLITNFHLPRSTLLMLVAALASRPNSPFTFTSWPDSPLGQAYQDAITHQYRFFSFGDAMLII